VFCLLIWETSLSPRRAPKRSLLPLTPRPERFRLARRTQVRLTRLLNSAASADLLSNAGDSSERKSTVCGITGILSTTADPWPIISSTRLVPRGSCRSDLFSPALAFASKRKICNNLFCSSEANLKILPTPYPPRLTVPRSRNGRLLTVRKR
jgi:hypothetical protein